MHKPSPFLPVSSLERENQQQFLHKHPAHLVSPVKIGTPRPSVGGALSSGGVQEAGSVCVCVCVCLWEEEKKERVLGIEVAFVRGHMHRCLNTCACLA